MEFVVAGWCASKKVVEALSNYKKQEILLLAIWEVRIEKEQGRVSLGLVLRKKERL